MQKWGARSKQTSVKENWGGDSLAREPPEAVEQRRSVATACGVSLRGAQHSHIHPEEGGMNLVLHRPCLI